MSVETWLAIAAVGVATYLTRASFIVAAHRIPLSDRARRSLRFIPLAVLPAIAAPAVVHAGDVSAIAPRLAAAALAGVVAWRTRSVPLTIALGLAALALLQLLGLRVG